MTGFICSHPVYEYKGWTWESTYSGPWPLRKDGEPMARAEPGAEEGTGQAKSGRGSPQEDPQVPRHQALITPPPAETWARYMLSGIAASAALASASFSRARAAATSACLPCSHANAWPSSCAAKTIRLAMTAAVIVT